MRRLVLALLFVPTIASAQPGTDAASLPHVPVPPAVENHLTVEGSFSLGFLISVGGSLQYERGVIGETTWIVRQETFRGGPFEEEGSNVTSFALLIGGRAYEGAWYLDAELGAALIRVDGYEDVLGPAIPLHYEKWPAGRLGIGVHTGNIDFGLALHVPALGFGLHLGLDFASW